jgi:hypothetical protein
MSSTPGRRRAETTRKVTAQVNTTIEVQSLRRSPRKWWAWSMRRYSIQNRPAV